MRTFQILLFCEGQASRLIGRRAGGATVRRRSLHMLAAVAVTGLAWVVTSPIASAQTVSTNIHTAVGHTVIKGLGSGKTFGLASCTSSAPTIAPCAISDARPPLDSVRVWCLAPTAPGGVHETVTYTADSPKAAIPATTLTTFCRGPRAAHIVTPGQVTSTALIANAPTYAVTSCSTDVFGTACTYSGESITKVCSLAASVNALPVMVTATVTLAGSPVITGKQIHIPFECKAANS